MMYKYELGHCKGMNRYKKTSSPICTFTCCNALYQHSLDCGMYTFSTLVHIVLQHDSCAPVCNNPK